MAYDAAKYDIAGSFSRGAEGTLKNRRAKQRLERADQLILQESDSLHARRRTAQKDQGIAGAAPIQFKKAGDMRSPFERVKDWFTKRDSEKVTPDMPGVGGGSTNYADAYKMGNKQAMADDQAKGSEAAMQVQEDAMLSQGYAEEDTQNYDQMMQSGGPGYANGGRAIPPTSPSVNSYADGGQVDQGVQHEESNPGVFTVGAQRADVATPVTQGIPQMADGGRMPDMSPRGTARGTRFPRIAKAIKQGRSTVSQHTWTKPVNLTKTARVAGGLAGIAAGATMESAHRSGKTGTEEYRARYGIPESPNDGWRRVVDDVGVRIKGTMEDLGNSLTGDMAGDFGSGMAAPPTAIPQAPTSGVEPVSEDEKVGQGAIAKGVDMAAEAEEANRPPGEIDFSKVDFKSGDFPAMSVKDWREYRHSTAADLILMGASYEEAHDQVTATQQKGFLNYMKQGQMHLAAGNAAAASSSLRMAFQYFPNGSDVKIGIHQDPNTGEPILLGMGMNDESGEGVGQPMYMDYQKLGQMIDNFGNPAAFRMWTKDRDDLEFEHKKFEEVTKPLAESRQAYNYGAAQGAVDRGRAALIDKLIGDPSDIAANEKVYRDRLLNDFDFTQNQADADILAALMSQIRAANPDQRKFTDNGLIEAVMSAYEEGPDAIQELMDEFGVQ
jgi:nucleotide-binding universal stress UspA family protein